MKNRRFLKTLFYLNLAIVVLLVGYKAYLNFLIPDPEALHTRQVDRIQGTVSRAEPFRFAVVGNINNSVGIFEERIVPMLNAADPDLVVSAGNAVSGGGEDKYKALQGTLSHLEPPFLLTFGENEYENFGAFRFYDHFGPHFYSVRAGNSRLIFLDSTGKTPWRWQVRWLEDLLARDDSNARFLFLGHPLFQPGNEALFAEEEDFLHPEEFRPRGGSIWRPRPMIIRSRQYSRIRPTRTLDIAYGSPEPSYREFTKLPTDVDKLPLAARVV